MTEFERPQRALLPRPSSASQLQLGHAGARGGELLGSELTTGVRPWGLGVAAGHHRQAGALWWMTHIAGAAAAAAWAHGHVQR